MQPVPIKPFLFVVSGPSGAGKKTMLEHIRLKFPQIEWVPTYTTRQPRPGEQDGVDYHFVSDERFQALAAEGEIYEYTRTYGDCWYGSPRRLLDASEQKDLIVELDVKGFSRVRSVSQRTVVGIFILLPSQDAQSKRISERASEHNLNARLAVSDEQLPFAWYYNYVILNEDREAFLDNVATVVRAEFLQREGIQRLYARRHEFDATLKRG